MEFLTAYRKQIAAAKRPVPWLKIDLAPLLAVMFAILFIVMSPYSVAIDRHGGVVNQPSAVNAQPLPGAAREDAIEVVVTRDGRFYLRDREVTLNELPSAIREAVGRGGGHHVYLAADLRAKYGDVKAAVDKIGEAGIKNVSLLSDPRSPR
jgi:biopolymer transport protein ExbD